jgi:D-glycero-D-manno-heptose 1,7-bisphosphate phosphatase
MKAAVFLDRDGVIIENRETYVRTWSDVEFLPGALGSLAQLAGSPYAIVIVTNQSVVGRGLVPLGQIHDINRRIIKVIQQADGRVDGVYLCPHAPGDFCDCRKPKPGLLTQAAEELDLDLSRSFMIGDALSDMAAAEQAGIPQRFLVLSGRGADQTLLPQAAQMRPFLVVPTLVEAVAAIWPAADGPIQISAPAG